MHILAQRADAIIAWAALGNSPGGTGMPNRLPTAARRVLSCMFILALGSIGATCMKEPTTLEHLFSELQELEYSRAQSLGHSSAARQKDEKAVVREFVEYGPGAAPFLIGNLSEINKREEAFIRGPDDVDRGLEFMSMEGEAGRSLLIRYAICYILSDMYASANSKTRAQIIRAIVDTYLPSTHGREDTETLDGSLFRLGKDGVEGFLMLANSESEYNRCHASSILRELAVHGPSIDCSSEPQTRTHQIRLFRTWWSRNASAIQWPRFPGFFDVPRLPDRQSSSPDLLRLR